MTLETHYVLQWLVKVRLVLGTENISVKCQTLTLNCLTPAPWSVHYEIIYYALNTFDAVQGLNIFKNLKKFKNHWECNKSNRKVGQSIGSTELIDTTWLMIDSVSQILTGVVKLEVAGADLAEEAWSPTHPCQPAELTSDTGHCPQRCWILLFLDLNHCLREWPLQGVREKTLFYFKC